MGNLTEMKVHRIQKKGDDRYESMWVFDCPYCKREHSQILDGIPDNVDGGDCPAADASVKENEMNMAMWSWGLKGIRKVGKWKIAKSLIRD